VQYPNHHLWWWLVDFPHRNEKEHIQFYRKHNNSVRSYFKNRSSDFIELCWENGDGFEKLCNFLNCDIPDVPLPHANKWTNIRINKKNFIINKPTFGSKNGHF